MDNLSLLNKIAQSIYDKKGFNILALDVKNVSSLCDYVLIAEGNVERHLNAIAEEVITNLKKEKEIPSHTEGMQEADWIVIDYLNVIVHLFKPGLRQTYNLEELFKDAKIIDLKIKVENT